MTSKKDQLFTRPHDGAFRFNKDVASVFDDMVTRSVPFYEESQRLISSIASQYAQDNSNIYDLGCSTGTTLLALDPKIAKTISSYIGIDYSQDMLDIAREKTAKSPIPTQWIHHDLNHAIKIDNASIVILNLVLQFIKAENRAPLLGMIYHGMKQNGKLILFEKIQCESESNQDFFTSEYEAFKARNGYSQDEIKHKKTALKNVLTPLKRSENITLLENAGFENIESIFQWMNFTCLMAEKP